MTVGSNLTELLINKRNTDVFINSEPFMVQFVRRTVTLNDRHGLEDDVPDTLPPQRIRILHAPPRRRRKENNPPDQSLGEFPFAKDYLMGDIDLDVELGDTFQLDGKWYEVTYVFLHRQYETIANIGTRDQ
jgi:hypothetical protein